MAEMTPHDVQALIINYLATGSLPLATGRQMFEMGGRDFQPRGGFQQDRGQQYGGGRSFGGERSQGGESYSGGERQRYPKLEIGERKVGDDGIERQGVACDVCGKAVTIRTSSLEDRRRRNEPITHKTCSGGGGQPRPSGDRRPPTQPGAARPAGGPSPEEREANRRRLEERAAQVGMQPTAEPAATPPVTQ